MQKTVRDVFPNRFLQRFLIALTVSAVACPPALALRSINLHENTGMKEKVIKQIHAGAEEGLDPGSERDAFARKMKFFEQWDRGAVKVQSVPLPEGKRYVQSGNAVKLLDSPPAVSVGEDAERTSLLDVPQNVVVRAPVNPENPYVWVSANHAFCNACIARGWNPAEKRYEIIEWHYSPSWDFPGPPVSPGLLINALPGLLSGLQDLRIVISHREDSTVYPDPAQLQETWEQELRASWPAESEMPARLIQSVVLFPRAGSPKTNLSVIAGADGFAFLLRSFPMLSDPPIDFLREQDFRVWSWDDVITTGVRPTLARSHLEDLPGMEEVAASWEKVDATPEREGIQRPFLPVFYDIGTFHLLTMVGRRKMFVVVVSPGEKEWVEDLLTFNHVPETRYRMIVSEDEAAGIGQARNEYAHQYRMHLVDKSREGWSDELFAGLEEDGVIPVGEWKDALRVTERYISGFM